MRTMFTIEYKNNKGENVETTSCFQVGENDQVFARMEHETFESLYLEYRAALRIDPHATLLFNGKCNHKHN